jgi:CMP-2-keto-3-deoxyoctulosonic acid synthetase
MYRILILDSDTPFRTHLVESVERTVHTEVVLVPDEDHLVARVKVGGYAAVFANAELLEQGASRLVEAVRSAIVRPMLVIASNEKSEDLDPELVTLIVRKPYDVATLTGILLSAVQQLPGGGQTRDDSKSIS